MVNRASSVPNRDGSIVTNEVSTLGIFWDAVQPRPATNDLQGVTVFGEQFVVSGGSGTILTSPDAITWTRRDTPTVEFLSSVRLSQEASSRSDVPASF